VTLDEAALQAWGARVGAAIQPPAFLALSGELGAGKSVLARAIARGAGVEGAMPSPTYNLVFRYEGARGVEVVHMDLYRLDSPEQVWALGWRELGAPNEIVIVEWPERAAALLPPDRWDVRLEHAGPTLRDVTVVARGVTTDLPPLGG
jgi:tRNA threonylcarbamoyladenosine biosynthesis protein TsaE